MYLNWIDELVIIKSLMNVKQYIDVLPDNIMLWNCVLSYSIQHDSSLKYMDSDKNLAVRERKRIIENTSAITVS